MKNCPFAFDDKRTNFLYMNGVVDQELSTEGYMLRFPCPFVQKRLFSYFAYELFNDMGKIFEPFVDISDTITDTTLNIPNLLRRYEAHLRKNRDWMLKDAPRRSDMRVREAVFHFNLYAYLERFFGSYPSRVWPEFPTGNGKVDLMIQHGGRMYVLELKSYKDLPAYQQALAQAGRYGKQLDLARIYLVMFVETMPDDARQRHEVDCVDTDSGVIVRPLFVATGA